MNKGLMLITSITLIALLALGGVGVYFATETQSNRANTAACILMILSGGNEEIISRLDAELDSEFMDACRQVANDRL